MVQYGAPPPRIFINDDDPRGVKDKVHLLDKNLRELSKQVNRFYYALTLIDYSDLQAQFWRAHHEESMVERMHHWKCMGARDIALALGDFEESLRGANDAAKDLRPKNAPVSGDSAFKLLDRFFPDRAKFRNAAAHTTLSRKNKTQHDKHASKGDVEIPGVLRATGNVTLVADNVFSGSSFSTTFGQKVVTVDLTYEALKNLETVKVAAYSMVPKRLRKPASFD